MHSLNDTSMNSRSLAPNRVQENQRDKGRRLRGSASAEASFQGFALYRSQSIVADSHLKGIFSAEGMHRNSKSSDSMPAPVFNLALERGQVNG